MESPPTQKFFETCYRGRQSAMHHRAYMRIGKVFPALEILRKNCLSTNELSVFDYGFGAGTLFRHLPSNCRLYGVEQDPVTVREVTDMLQSRGFPEIDLREIDINHWQDHPLLSREYDLIICSHVLEHLPDPVQFLARLRTCLAPQGTFVGLVPLNELRQNPHHYWKTDRSLIDKWIDSAGLRLIDYAEEDPWAYWIQPLYANDSSNRIIAQALSLGMGLLASSAGQIRWAKIGQLFATVSRSKPTQACFAARAA